MAGAARFLYGLALGISLGIIGSKLAGAASSAPAKAAERSRRRRRAPSTANTRRKAGRPS